MTMILELKDISKKFLGKVVLDKVNLKIKKGEKIGIVGNNGCGKTTLANIIDNKLEVDGGNILWYKEDIRIGYMRQAIEYEDMPSTLSGGEKTKKLLAKVLYDDYDLLILDEPTNHLDYLGISWLIKCINEIKAAVIIISHDRYFLDKTINHIVEIEDCNIKSYNGNYTWYREQKKKDYQDRMHAYIEQEKVKENINSQIDKLSRWAKNGHETSTKKPLISGEKFGVKEYYRAKAMKKDKQVKSKIKRLKKIEVEGIEKPKAEEKIIFSTSRSKKVGSVVIRAEDISKSFGNKTLFKDSSFFIMQKEKVALLGVNGCGKTTLINAMMGKEEVNGKLYLSTSARIGYISQDASILDEESSIIDLFHASNKKQLGEIRTKLNLLGFNKESLNKKIKVLSMGERMKLKILLMIEKECDVLILDEPTNHIDIHVREKLEEVLLDYDGTIILVTHDRYMAERLCSKLLIFKNNKIVRYEYGIEEYLNRKTKSLDKENLAKEQKIIIENKISCLISKLSLCKKDSSEYLDLEKEYNELIKRK